jgi:hypothetical protein
VPNAVVDLLKGEQQKNVDFALIRCLDIIGIDVDQGIMLIYDIVCQYIVHLIHRIGNELPAGLKIERAIDHLHVHGHKDDCFYRFISTFIPGAAICAGQILESLWSSLNTISPTARTATLPHRAEILDDHCCDSNYKKMLAMTETLCSRYITAKKTVQSSDIYFCNLRDTVQPAILTAWEAEVRAAEAQRPDNLDKMDVYAARVSDGITLDPVVASPTPRGGMARTGVPASGLTRMRGGAPASASSTRLRVSSATPLDLWMEYALIVEETQ